ncbi:MAG: hypothetical protein ACPGCP_06740 [Candidatus Nanopelagicales bacterium]
MSLETTAERQQVVSDADTATKSFLKRVASMISEADSYIDTLTVVQTDLASAKTASDAALAADSENLALQVENATLAGKQAENTAVLAQATSLKTQIAAALAG